MLDVLLASLLLNLFALAMPLFVMNVYDRVVPNAAFESLWVLVSGMALIVVFELLIKLVRSHTIDQIGERLDVALSSGIYDHLMAIQLDSKRIDRGVLVNSLQHFEHLRQFFSASVITAFIDIPFAVIFLVCIFYISGGAIALVPCVAIFLILALGLIKQYKVRRLAHKYQAAASANNAMLVESVHQLEEIKTLNLESIKESEWRIGVSDLATNGRSLKRQTFYLQGMTAFFAQIALIMVIAFGVYRVADYQMSLGALIASVLLLNRVLVPFSILSNLLGQYYQTKVAISGLDALLALPRERNGSDTKTRPDPFVGEIEMKNLVFRYPESELPALDVETLVIKPGEKVALVGTMGSGKSTLLKLIPGLLWSFRGQLRVSGVELRNIDLQHLRSSIGYLPQQVSLFRGTVRENILGGTEDIADRQLIDMLNITGLGGSLNNLPGGLDFVLGDSGEGLSGGQRQAVGIMRALISQPELLLFDEPGQGLDNQAEHRFKTALAGMLENKTFIVSTHKASMLSLVERVIVLDDGKIIADGSKQSILDGLQQGRIQTGAAK